jgi:hypothetical protein
MRLFQVWEQFVPSQLIIEVCKLNDSLTLQGKTFPARLLFYRGFTFILVQRFSTWGTRTPRGTRAACRGYAKC